MLRTRYVHQLLKTTHSTSQYQLCVKPRPYYHGSNILTISVLSSGLITTSLVSEWQDWINAFRDTIKQKYRQLNSDSRKQALHWIVVTNAMVFGMWKFSSRSRNMTDWMERHFTCSYQGLMEGRLHTLITSFFSHAGLLHLGVNMFMLLEFGPLIMETPYTKPKTMLHASYQYFSRKLTNGLSIEEFYKLYFGAGISSSISSIMASRCHIRPSMPSLGASGAVLGVFTVFCLQHPDSQLAMFGLVKMTAMETLILLSGLNVVGATFWKMSSIDYAAHLGGQATGLLYEQYRKS